MSQSHTKTRILSISNAEASGEGVFPPQFTKTEKRRIFGAVLLTAALAGHWINSGLDNDRMFQAPVPGASASESKDSDAKTCETITVKSGDTAWEIAREHVGLEGEVRGVVDDIQKQIAEQHPDGVMQPGDEVKIC